MIVRHVPRSGAARSQVARRFAGERGETLIEVLFTVVLMGTGFLAILSAIFTSTNISDRNNQRTKASISVQGFAESLQQPAIDPPAVPPGNSYPQQWYTYQPCASPASYALPQTSDGALPAGYTATIEKIRYFTGTFNGDGPVFTNGALSQAAATNLCYSTLYGGATVTDVSGNPQTMFFDGRVGSVIQPGMQEITIRIDSGQRRDQVIDTLVLIKRDQRCPATYENADLGPC